MTAAMSRWGGVCLPDSQLASVERRLHPRLRQLGLGSFAEYYHQMVSLGDRGQGGDEMQILFDLLVPHESYFLREERSLQWIVQEVVSRPGPWTVWSAGCAYGQEPLSLLILAADGGVDLSRLRIIGTDAGPRTVAQARMGLYSSRSLRAVSRGLERAYFRPVESSPERRWAVRPGLGSRVAYHVGNLLHREGGPGLEACDVILCRNVLLYFSEEARRDAVEMLERQLRPDGLLVFGVSDRLSCGERLRVEPNAPVNVFRKCVS
jgi:chemotaxis protein methyltransferase CheR